MKDAAEALATDPLNEVADAGMVKHRIVTVRKQNQRLAIFSAMAELNLRNEEMLYREQMRKALTITGVGRLQCSGGHGTAAQP